jgi:hypothetical protein
LNAGLWQADLQRCFVWQGGAFKTYVEDGSRKICFKAFRMAELRDPFRYHEEAAHFRELAAAATDSRELRDSDLGLALQYERLAGILEERDLLSTSDRKATDV